MELIENNNPTSLSPSANTCYHCGEDCPEHALHIEDKNFCCQGCQTVYEILAENQLCNYYDLENTPGLPQKQGFSEDRFSFLENTEIVQTLLNFSSEDLNKVNLKLPNIHCSSCIWLLENLYRLKPGILSTRVNFMRRELALDFNPQQISFREVAELLSSLGYPPQINLEDLKEKKTRSENRSLLYKIGITGFCFGNIMLLSFPDYLAVEDWVDGNYKNFFAYLNLILALPILLYSSRDYYISAYKSLKVGVINLDVPICLGIFALFGRSFFEIVFQNGMGYMDSLAGLLFFLLVGKWVQNQSYERLSFERDYKSYFPLAIHVKNLAKDQFEIKKVTELQKNDIIQIRNQELIPTDGILLSPQAFIDYSFVSGESEALEKVQGDYLYAGGRQIGRSIEMAVQKEVSQSYLTQLWNNEVFKNEAQNERLDQHVALFSRYFTLSTLGIAFAALIFWFWVDARLMWNAFTAVLIIACPCALALASPYALGNAMRIFGKNNFYLKNSGVVANLAHISQVVFDKTGTITLNEQAKINFIGADLSEEEKSLVFSLCQHSTHPLSRRIRDFLAGSQVKDIRSFKESEGLGIYGRWEETQLRLGSAKFVDLPSDAKTSEETQISSRVYLKINEKVLGYFEFQNRYRPQLKTLLGDLQKHYQTALITGDQNKEKTQLRQFFGAHSELQFQQSPKEKLAFIKAQQNKGEKVLMLGDGLNDAGALKQSEVGIALSEDTSSFSPACDAIMDARAFSQLNQFLTFSKTTLKIIRASFILSLMYNIIGLSFALSGTLSPVLAAILMPLSSVSVVAFVVLSSNYYAGKAQLKT